MGALAIELCKLKQVQEKKERPGGSVLFKFLPYEKYLFVFPGA
jgi:hypothetical protein